MAKPFTRMFMGWLDAKNRVSLPADYRDVLAERSNSRTEVMLDGHPDWPALRGYDVQYSETLQHVLDEKHGEGLSVDKELDAIDLFGSVETCGIDASGRLVMGDWLRAKAEIDRELLFIGLGSHFLVWNPDRAIAMIDKKGAISAFVGSERKRKAATA